jgi:restriction system protein
MARRRSAPSIDRFPRLPWHTSLGFGVVSGALAWGGLPQLHLPGWRTSWAIYTADHYAHNPYLLGLLGMVPVTFCLVTAWSSWQAQQSRRRWFDMQHSLSSLRNMHWAQFEQLVGEAFRRLGYRVELTGQGGADGGIDLILCKSQERILVQCKRWKQNVGAPVVREMYGLLMADRAASRIKIVSAAKFTKEALAFAEGKPIDLVGDQDLLTLIRTVQTRSGARAEKGGAYSQCPECGRAMLLKTSPTSHRQFYGCSQFPACRGSRTVR